MSENTFRVVMPADLNNDKRGPTLGERLRARRCTFIDETTDPGEQHALSFASQFIVFVRNFRGFQKGKKGKKHDEAFSDAVVIRDLPEVIPLDQIDDFCEVLQELKGAGSEALKQGR